jgi:hypothetical protein
VSNLPRIPILDLKPEVEALCPTLSEKFKEVKAARKKVRATVEEEPMEPLSHLDE